MTNNVKVIFVNRYFYPDHSATSQFVSDLAFKCVEWGLNVTAVASTQCYDDPSASLPTYEIHDGVEVHRVEGVRFGRSGNLGRGIDYISFIYGAIRKLQSVVTRDTVVVAKTDPPMLGAFLAGVVRRRGGVLVNWLQDLFPETFTALHPNRVVHRSFAPLGSWRNRRLEPARMNVVIGADMRKHLVSQGIEPGKIEVIHNWAYNSKGDMDEQSAAIRQEWRLDGKFVVGYFGNLGRAHEHQTVLETMTRLRDEPAVRFLFVGGGALLDRLGSGAEERGLNNFDIRPYVPRETLPDVLKAADVHLVILRPELEGFVVPSKFAGVVAAGRPVIYIGSDRGEIGSRIRDSSCGYVVPTGSSEELAARIVALSEDPKTVARMGARAEDIYQEHYRSELAFQKWRAVFETVRRETEPEPDGRGSVSG